MILAPTAIVVTSWFFFALRTDNLVRIHVCAAIETLAVNYVHADTTTSQIVFNVWMRDYLPAFCAEIAVSLKYRRQFCLAVAAVEFEHLRLVLC